MSARRWGAAVFWSVVAGAALFAWRWVPQGFPLTLLDGDEVQCRVTLLDFTSQASTELSPTAGFGIAQNAIELLASEQAPAQTILFSLAATSVGRGWDTVGHAPGNYRNRMRVE